MKKLLLASAIAALSVSAAHAAPTVYGKVHVGVSAIDSDDTDTNVTLDSFGSRLGFKGSEPITANTDVIYTLEYGVNVDSSNVSEKAITPEEGNEDLIFDNKNSQFYSRHTYLGLKNKDFGTVKFGYQYGPTDYVNNVTVAAGSVSGTSSNLSDGNRVANSILWHSPEYAGLPVEVSFMTATDEEYDDAGFGGAVMFDQGTGFTVGAGYSKDLEINGTVLRASATADMGKMMAMPLTLGVLYQQAELDGDNTNSEDELLLAAEYNIPGSAWTPWAEYDMVSDLGGVEDADLTRFAIGGKYAFNKAATGHVFGGFVNTDNGQTDSDSTILGTSLEYKF